VAESTRQEFNALMRRRLVLTSVFTAVLGLTVAPAASQASSPLSASPTSASSAAASCAGVLDTPATYDGTVPAPKKVLGYELGSKQASNADILKYWDAVDRASDRVVTGTFATSWQGQPLRYALVGSPTTLSRLPRITADLAKLRDPATPASDADAIVARTPAILWISANVHGNEPSGGDAVLRLLYQLADRNDCVAKAIRDNALVGLIPTQNPDGRTNDVRTNAYSFDLNRDWFARTQPETDGKLDLLWKYPPQLYVDEHEMGGNGYFFPPNSDPVYHETPDRQYTQIEKLYGAANTAAFTANGWKFETYQAGYDMFYQGYGDTVPTTQFGAAGMTFEQGGDSPYPAKTNHHYTSAITTLYTGATNRARLLREWRQTWLQALREGQACRLEPNATFNPGNEVLIPVPKKPVCGYFLTGDSPETRDVVRRLQQAKVEVSRLTSSVVVPDYKPYGQAVRSQRLPKGTYWVSLAQVQKHWVQAMLGEDTYTPFPYFYDVSGWNNAMLAGVGGGSTGTRLDVPTAPVSLLPAAAAAPVADAPRIGIIDQRPEPTYQYQTTGWLRWRLEQDWKLDYTALTPEQVTPAALSRLDVLLVPDVDGQPTFDRLGQTGRQALRSWVNRGGRYVGWQGGTVLAKSLGLTSVGLSEATAVSPGALLSLNAPRANTWALWDDSDAQMSPGGAAVITSFPASPFVSGYAEDTDTLAGSAVEAVDRVGAGSTTVFSIEPNFRGYSDGTAELLLDAVKGTPGESARVAPRPLAAEAPSVLGLTRSTADHVADEQRERGRD
jgi:hypothetical protein